MRKKYDIIDANIILRFLIDDNIEQKEKVRILFKNYDRSKIEIPDVVIMEVIFVLLGYYHFTKETVIEKLSMFINYKIFALNRKLIQKSLEIYRDHEVSFVDSYLCAKIALNENNRLYTFDKKLTKINDKNIIEP